MADSMKPAEKAGKKLTTNYIEDLAALTLEDYAVIADYLNRQPGRNPVTPEDVRDEMYYFGIYRGLVQMEERVIGIVDCYISKEENSAYGENLLIDPEYQGHIYGGSFMMSMFEQLRKVFHKYSDNEHYKVYSSFLAGNQRAGALYTRLGYFPLAQTWIQNFFPYIYDYPFARKFFTTREIGLVNAWKYYKPTYDEMLNEKKVKVYPYVFGVKDQFLRVMIDAVSDYPLLVEDNQVLLTCWIEDQQAYIDLQKKVHWLLKNNSSEKLEINLVASGLGRLKFKREETVVLMPGECKLLTSGIIASGTDDPEMNYVDSNFSVNGQTVAELRTGYRLKEFYEVKFERNVSKPFRAGERYQRSFTFVNTYASPIKAELRFWPGNGVELFGGKEFSLEVLPGQSDKVILDFATLKSGIGIIQAELKLTTFDIEAGEQVQLVKNLPLQLNVLQHNGVLAWRTDMGRLLLENEHFLLAFQDQKRDGSFMLYDKHLKENVMYFPQEEIGPPFIPEFVHDTIPYFWVRSTEVKEEQGFVSVKTEFENKYYRGIYIVREVKISAANNFSIDYTLVNQTDQEFTSGILRKLWNGWKMADGVLPLKQGLVRQCSNELDFPGTALDVQFAENWAALENEGRVLGVVWEGGKVSFRKSYSMPQIDSGLFTIKPGEIVKIPTYFFYYGGGTAKDVRKLYLDAANGKIVQLKERQMLDINLKEQQLVINGKRGEFALKLDSAIQFKETKWITGQLTAKGPAGWKVEVADDKLKLELSEDVQPGLYTVQIMYVSPVFERTWTVEVWVTHSLTGIVEVAEESDGTEKLYTIDNGQIAYRVAPGFGERIISLTKGEEEYLCTNYPAPSNYHKFSPWFGGVGFSASFGRLLRQDTYPVYYSSQAAEWKGLGFLCVAQGQPGLFMKLEYLTTPNSPVLAICGQVKNESGTSITGSVTVDINLANLQKVSEISAYIAEQSGFTRLKFKSEPEKLDNRGTKGWLAIETGKENYFVCVNPGEANQLTVKNWGNCGVHCTATQNIMLEAGEVQEFTVYLLLADDLNQALKYRDLKPLRVRGED